MKIVTKMAFIIVFWIIAAGVVYLSGRPMTMDNIENLALAMLTGIVISNIVDQYWDKE